MKIFLPLSFMIILMQSVSSQEAGIRPYTAAELKRWTFVCEGLKKAMPTSYKDHYAVTVSACGAFDWSERDTKGNPLTVYNKKGEATGNNPYCNVYFKMSEDSADALTKRIDEGLLINRKPDGSFDQKQINLVSNRQNKFLQSHDIKIVAMVNGVVSIAKQYEISTKPVKLSLPINAFAVLYTVPDGKLMGSDDDEISFDNTNVYQDKAIIVISAKPPTVVPTKTSGKGTMKEDKITPPDGTIVSTAPIKNIVVEISGYENDVRALIEKIDWKALQALLGK